MDALKKTTAAVLTRVDAPLEIMHLDVPPLQHGQVLVKVLWSGVCHSQLNEQKGYKGKEFIPHTMGHEGSGVVEEAGPGVSKVVKGDFVVLTWIKAQGAETGAVHYVGDKGKVNSGACSTFLSHAVVSENRLVKIPSDIPPDIAALLGCAIPTGAGIVKNELALESKCSLAIFGIGGIGSAALLEAVALGCANIIAIDVHEDKLRFARELGAHHVLNASDGDVVKRIRALAGGKGVDFSVECSGSRSGMESAFDCLHDRGLAVIAGNLKPGERMSIIPFDLIKGKRIRGSWAGASLPDRDIPFFVQQYREGKLPLQKLISRRYPLSGVNAAMDDLASGRVVRALIDCQG